VGSVLGLQLTRQQQLTVSATLNRAEDTDFAALSMDLRSDRTTLLNLNHKVHFDNTHLKMLNTSLYVTDVEHKMDNFDKDLNPRKMNANTDAITLSYGGRTEASWMFSRAKLYTGVDLKGERAEGERTREMLMGPMAGMIMTDNVWNGGEIQKAGIFGEYHEYADWANVIVSARVEYNQAKATDPDAKFKTQNEKTEATQINPSLSIGAQKTWNQGFSAGLWLGRAQRSASLVERYINSFQVGLDAYEMLGNPELKPEVNNQLDISLGYTTDATQVNLGVFVSALQNYISSEIDPTLTPTMTSSPGVRRFKNIGEAFMTGFELSWQQGLFAGLSHHLNLAYTYGQNKIDDVPLPEIAPVDLRYTLSASFLKNSLHPEVTFRHVLKQDRVSRTFGEDDSPAFTVIDALLNYRLSHVFGGTIGIQNIMDETYYEHLNRNISGTGTPLYGRGRNIYISVFIDLM